MRCSPALAVPPEPKVSLAIFSFKSLVVLVQCLLEGHCTGSLDRGSMSSRLAPRPRSGQHMRLGRAFTLAVESCPMSERRAQWWPFDGVIPEKREWVYSQKCYWRCIWVTGIERKGAKDSGESSLYYGKGNGLQLLRKFLKGEWSDWKNAVSLWCWQIPSNIHETEREREM